MRRAQELDPDLVRHAAAVAATVGVMVEQTGGLSEQQRQAIVDAAWLHDIGKLAIPPEVLYKPGPLTDSEWIEMRLHPARGADVLAMSTVPSGAAELVRQHHEWHNGSGYPARLAGRQIELGARFIGVADAYDAMTSWRPYRAARSTDEAIDELRSCAGSQFDPEVVELFIAATVEQRMSNAQ